MHLSLKSGLGKFQSFLSRVLSGRVLDLFGSFTQDDTTVSDSSGEGNNATLYSGRYVSTDGVADKAINADCSAAGSALYYLTAWVRSSTTGTKWAQVSPTSSCYFTVATANVWQQLISTTILSEDVPSDVALGFADSTFPLTYSAANWSDVRLVNATTGATVARWQLNESADGDLDGYPVLDSSGNGYHGTHTGCAGGTGEGIDSDVVGAVFAANEDKMYFDGTDTKVSTTTLGTFYADNDIIEFEFDAYPKGAATDGFVFSLGYNANNCVHFVYQPSDPRVMCEFIVGGNNYKSFLDWQDGRYIVNINKTTETLVVTYPDGTTDGSSGGQTFGKNGNGNLDIGFRPTVGSRSFKGIITNFVLRDETLTDVLTFDGSGLTTWTDTTNSYDGTVSGSPVTVGQKRATILQTAGMDWNKRMWFDGVNDYVEVDKPASDTFTIGGTFLLRNAGAYGLWASGDNVNNRIFVGNTTSTDGIILFCVNNSITIINESAALTDLNDGELHTWELSTSISGTTVTVDGVEVISVVTQVDTSNFTTAKSRVGARFGTGYTNYLKGFCTYYESGVITWDGTIADGNAIGTVNGSPSAYLIPESITAGTDALGNAIAEPRPTADTWNLFGDGEYGQVADADSLDLTTEATWEIWGNFYGTIPTSQYIFAKYLAAADERSWAILRQDVGAIDSITVAFGSATGTFSGRANWNALSDKIQHVVITFSSGSLLLYLDGQLVGAQDLTVGTIPTSMFEGIAPLTIGSLDDSLLPYDNKLARPKIYNRAFTADEVLQNYNAQKGAFGL